MCVRNEARFIDRISSGAATNESRRVNQTFLLFEVLEKFASRQIISSISDLFDVLRAPEPDEVLVSVAKFWLWSFDTKQSK